MRRIGLIGGTSWVSSEHYYRALNQGVAERLGGAHSAPVTLWSVEFGPFAAMQHAGEWTGVADVLCEAARGLVAAGCEGIALAANTTHLCADDVRAVIGDVPLVDLVELTAQAVEPYRTVGLLGTQFTMSSAMFPDAFGRHGVHTVTPSEDDQRRVHEVIYDELTHDVVSDAARRDYLAIVGKLVAEGAEAVVLACTELGMLRLAAEASVPLLDTTDIHCRALIDFMLEGPS